MTQSSATFLAPPNPMELPLNRWPIYWYIFLKYAFLGRTRASDVIKNGLIGQSITLECPGDVAAAAQVTWGDWVYNMDRFPADIYTSERGTIDTGHMNSANMEVDSTTFALTISNLKFADYGEYICATTDDAGVETETMFKLYLVGIRVIVNLILMLYVCMFVFPVRIVYIMLCLHYAEL